MEGVGWRPQDSLLTRERDPASLYHHKRGEGGIQGNDNFPHLSLIVQTRSMFAPFLSNEISPKTERAE